MSLRTALVVALASADVAPARADWIFGGNSRVIAMGGAGLAVVDKSGYNTLLNPAALALYNRRVVGEFPSLGVRARGIPLDAAFEHLTGNPDENEAVDLARDFGKRDSQFGANIDWGIRFGHVEARAFAVGAARLFPNTALRTWAQTANGDVTRLTGAERADLIGAAIYSLPTITAAERVSPPGSPTRIEAGARVKLMRAFYTHYLVDANAIRTNGPATPAPELGGGTSLHRDGIGVDLGVLAHPRDHAGFSGALVITNAIEPTFRFLGTDQSGAPYQYDFQPRSVSMGSAWEGGRMLVALDLVDLTASYGDVQARLGAEYATRGVGFRAGYASARGFTAGFGWRFIQVAYGARAPIDIAYTLRF